MTDIDAVDERLRAVERTLTGDDRSVPDLQGRAELTSSVADLTERMERIEDRLDELDAATQALRGYVGNVRAVNADVERRADAALAAVESLEEDAVDEHLPEPRADRLRREREGSAPESDAATESEDDAETERPGLLDGVRAVL